MNGITCLFKSYKKQSASLFFCFVFLIATHNSNETAICPFYTLFFVDVEQIVCNVLIRKGAGWQNLLLLEQVYVFPLFLS